jgi:dolichol-phosphate mannosyltransferase
LIIIAIPAYNEEKNIGSLLERIAALGHNPAEYRVLVVNDGSTDNTVNVVKSFQDRMPVTLLNHETNRGVGQVFRTVFAAVLDMAGPEDIIVTMEADNTSDLAILKEMIRQVEQGSDVVLASCYAEGGGVEGSNIYRIVLSEAANLLLRLFYPIGVRTYSSFYRAYRAEALRAAYEAYEEKLIEEDGFVCMVEALVKLSRLPLHITEVPMVLSTDKRQGGSKMKVVRTIWGYLRFIARDFMFRQRPVFAGTTARRPGLKRVEG